MADVALVYLALLDGYMRALVRLQRVLRVEHLVARLAVELALRLGHVTHFMFIHGGHGFGYSRTFITAENIIRCLFYM